MVAELAEKTMTTLSQGSALQETLTRLRRLYGQLEGVDLLRVMIEKEFHGRIALASSFGSEAAVLLAQVAEVDPATPVVFLDTGKLFPETLKYRQTLTSLLGLTNVIEVHPEAEKLRHHDPDGKLWRRDAEACCALRKTQPMERALMSFDAWITGRKRYHEGDRVALDLIESSDPWIKLNPLVQWSRERIEAEIDSRGLPPHPLVDRGYPSIGCWPCTHQVRPGDPLRSGRWKEQEKTECGIHRTH
jgi:phosphoadenosine phosphosulfate reductase